MTDPFSILQRDPFDVFGPAARVRRPREEPFELSPEEEQGILKGLARKMLSGVGWVGESIDKPWAAVRGLAVGKPAALWNLVPFSDTIADLAGLPRPPRVSGRKVLETWGAAGPNRPGLDVGDVAGFALEMADPFAFALRPFVALGKAGQAAKAAGLLDDAARLGRQMGMTKRVARMRLTPADVIGAADDPAKAGAAFLAAAKGMKQNPTELLQQPLGGAIGYGWPLRETAGVIGKAGGPGEHYARALDWVADTLRWKKPGRAGATLFSSKMAGAMPEPIQRNMASHFRAKESARAAAAQLEQDLAAKMRPAGAKNPEELSTFIRSLAEAPDAPSLNAALGRLKTSYPEIDSPGIWKLISDHRQGALAGARAWGVGAAELADPKAAYFPRHAPPGALPKAPRDLSRLGTMYGERIARNPLLTEFEGGTETVKQVIKQTRELLDLPTPPPPKDIAKALETAYGTKASSLFYTVRQQKQLAKARAAGDTALEQQILAQGRERWPALVKFVKGLDPELASEGLFTRDVVWDVGDIVRGAANAEANAVLVRNVLLEPGVLGSRGLKLSGVGQHPLGHKFWIGPRGKKLSGVLRRLGINAGDETEGFIRKLWETSPKLQSAYPAINPDVVKEIKAFAVADDVAQGLLKLQKSFRVPDEVAGAVNLFDSATNLSKTLLTNVWPAFLARNLSSSQLENILRDTFSGKLAAATWKMLRGRSAAEFVKSPTIRAEAARRGIALPTAQQATDIARDLAVRWGVTGKFGSEATEVIGKAGVPVSQSFAGYHAGYPGGIGQYGHPFDWGRVGRTWAAREPGTTWKPWALRGVGAETTTRFGPAAAGQQVAEATETMARFPAWLKLVDAGYDPAVAKEIIDRVQVSYAGRSYTPFEQRVMKRAFPWYSFAKGKAVDIAQELFEHPGGKTAAMIRATGKVRDQDEFTPEYVSRSLSIPWPSRRPGVPAYLTSFGAMYEDPLAFLGAGPKGLAFEAASRLNPYAKAGLEWITGRSFFQQGPSGGRDIRDMDPLLGRIAANVTGRREAYELPEWLGGRTTEVFAAGSPLSRLLSSTRTATELVSPYGRKTPIDVALNLLTGMRVTHVTPAAEQAIADQAVKEAMRAMGAKRFEVVNFRAEDLAAMSPAQQEAAVRLKAIKTLFVKRAKERRELEQLEDRGISPTAVRRY